MNKKEIRRFINVYKEFGGSYAIKAFYHRLSRNSEKYINESTDLLNSMYSNCLSEAKRIKPKPTDNQRVWSFWWQGYDSLPEVLKVTYKSQMLHIKKCGYEYTLIDKNNLNEYLDIPDYIQKKVEDGIISLTHFSDYIRISLLQKYGGLWVDITLLMVDDLSKEVFGYPFFSINLNGTDHKFVGMGQKITQCRWAGFILGTNETNNTLISYIKNSLESYWKDHNTVIDYFLMNLLIRGAYERDSQIKQYIDMIPQNNINLYKLQGILNTEFDQKIWSSLILNQSFFKVTQKISLSKNINGMKTFYGYISSLYGL